MPATALVNFGQYAPGQFDVYETSISTMDAIALSASGSTIAVDGTVEMTLAGGATQATATVAFAGPKTGTHNEIEHP